MRVNEQKNEGEIEEEELKPNEEMIEYSKKKLLCNSCFNIYFWIDTLVYLARIQS